MVACARLQDVAQEPIGKADYAEIFFEAWMKKLDASEPEYAELSLPAVPIIYRPPPSEAARL